MFTLSQKTSAAVNVKDDVLIMFPIYCCWTEEREAERLGILASVQNIPQKQVL